MYSGGSCYSGSSNQSNYSSNSVQPSGLEQIASSYTSRQSGGVYNAAPQTYNANAAIQSYSNATSGTYNSNKGATYAANENHYLNHQEQHAASFQADEFLDPFRPAQRFIGNAEDIKPFVEEAFRTLMNAELPQDIIVRVGSEEQLAKAYPGQWSRNIAGFALNRVGWGTSEIFARHDELDRLLLTIGHELGHVMTQPLPLIHNEEAKAFAFSLAWMKVIKDNNIAGIGHAINPSPAKNGLHDIAFNFVANLVESGKRAMDVFSELVLKVIAVR